MANSAPLDSNVPSKKSPAAEGAPVEPPMEEKLRQFWEKNARTIYFLCGVLVVGVLARGAYDYYQRQHEADIEATFAAATTPQALKAFIADHPDHPLAAVASLNQADAAYSQKNYTDAIANYQRAAEILKTGALAERAQMGAALAKLESGDRAGGEEALKKLADDNKALKATRAEAAFHLATIAAAASRWDDAQKYLETVSSDDPNGMWAQKAMMLRVSLPLPTPAAAAPSLPVSGLPKIPAH